MINIGNKSVDDVRLGATAVNAVVKNEQVLWERDMSEILVTFYDDATADDCYYNLSGKITHRPELFDNTTKTALFRFKSDDNLRFLFSSNKSIQKIQIKKLGSFVKNIQALSSANGAREFIMSGCNSKSLQKASGICFNSNKLISFVLEDCYFPNAELGVLVTISRNLESLTLRNITCKQNLILNGVLNNVNSIRNFTIENINSENSEFYFLSSFYNCNYIENIDLSKINDCNKLFIFNDNAFLGCRSLKTITLDDKTLWIPRASIKNHEPIEYYPPDDIDLSDCKMSFSNLDTFLKKGILNPDSPSKNKVYIPDSFTQEEVTALQASCKVGTIVLGAPPAN